MLVGIIVGVLLATLLTGMNDWFPVGLCPDAPEALKGHGLGSPVCTDQEPRDKPGGESRNEPDFVGNPVLGSHGVPFCYF